MPPKESADKDFDAEFIATAFGLAARPEIKRVIYISDEDPLEEHLRKRGVRAKLIRVVTSEAKMRHLNENDIDAIDIPDYAFDRLDKIKMAVAGAINASLVVDGDRVLCVTGDDPHASPDAMVQMVIGDEFEEQVSLKLVGKNSPTPSDVLETVLHLATRIGYEGYEGRPVGTIFTVGDAITVMEKSRQIMLNPFQGYPEDDRNILNPELHDTLCAFAVMDGAFVVREDGVLLAAGRFLHADASKLKLPMGQGSRHAAAAAMSCESKAVCFVVSETGGTVRVYQGGKMALEVRQQLRRS